MFYASLVRTQLSHIHTQVSQLTVDMRVVVLWWLLEQPMRFTTVFGYLFWNLAGTVCIHLNSSTHGH